MQYPVLLLGEALGIVYVKLGNIEQYHNCVAGYDS
jgi:hypothetical protein